MDEIKELAMNTDPLKVLDEIDAAMRGTFNIVCAAPDCFRYPGISFDYLEGCTYHFFSDSENRVKITREEDSAEEITLDRAIDDAKRTYLLSKGLEMIASAAGERNIPVRIELIGFTVDIVPDGDDIIFKINQ